MHPLKFRWWLFKRALKKRLHDSIEEYPAYVQAKRDLYISQAALDNHYLNMMKHHFQILNAPNVHPMIMDFPEFRTLYARITCPKYKLGHGPDNHIHRKEHCYIIDVRN